jgi:exopolysaccharide biosynthesis polyprenyl glycosylphosphotransferase
MNDDDAPALRQPLLLLDALTVGSAMTLAFVAHHALQGLVPLLREPPAYKQYAIVTALAVPVWLVLTMAFDLDRIYDRVWTRGQLTASLLKLHAAGFTALTILIFLTQSVVNRSLMVLFLVFSFGLMLGGRLLLLQRRWHQYATGLARDHWLLVGAPGPRLEAFIAGQEAGEFPPQWIGRLSGEPAAGVEDGRLPPRLGDLEVLPSLLGRHAVDLVVFFPPHDDPALVATALVACEEAGIPAAFPLALGQPGQAPPRVSRLRGHPSILFEVAAKPPHLLALKHAADFLLALALLLLLFPLLLLVGLAIFVTSGRPVLFAQERAGLHGRSFRMLKFRTMRRDAEQRREDLLARNEMDGPVFKVRGDPRVTRLGRLLRRFSLDELPQLVNVLLGQMSLVGPRPLPTEERRQIAGPYRRRLSMKPGITGLWQVSGRNTLGFDEWMRLDLEYVDRWTLSADLRILARTLGAVLRGSGAW